ncbi:MAG: aspartate-semialdehyde dehydrogenase, partial [Gammaproteobacteria bacterium]|nr:aspartate-semialdehyde dehydrogenase [Gammaproteobacteria bacterium]
MKLGVVGATGLVGQSFLSLLEKEKNFPIKELRLFSSRSKPCFFLEQKIQTQPLNPTAFKDLDICFFSAGADVSLKWAPLAVEQGAIVIDNSSAFRSDSDKLLIVPEVNSHLLNYKPQIISNPNCSTIQLVVILEAIEKAFGLDSVHVVSL